MKKVVLLFSVAVTFALTCGALASSRHHHSDTGVCCAPENESTWRCDRCDGSGRDPKVFCRTCRGTGKVTKTETCTYCDKGYVTDVYGKRHICSVCNGTMRVKVEQYCSSCSGWGRALCSKCRGAGEVDKN